MSGESTGLAEYVHHEIPHQAELKETPRLLPVAQNLVEVSLRLPTSAQKQDLPPPIEDTVILGQPMSSEQPEGDFNAETHMQWLCTRADELQNSPDIDTYLDQFTLPDIIQVRTILSRETNHPIHGTLSNIVLRHIRKKYDPEQLSAVKNPAGSTTDVTQPLRQGFLTFSKEFYRTIDEVLPPETLLGVTELDRRTIQQHASELYRALLQMRHQPAQDHFIRSLMNRSISQLNRKIDEQKREAAQRQATAEATDKIAGMDTSVQAEKAPISEQQQRWISSLREMRYRNLLQVLNGIQETEGVEGAQRWFLDLANNLIRSEGRESLDMQHIQSLRYINVVSQSASEIAGQEIERPVFVFQEPTEFTNFLERFLGTRSEGTNAIHLAMSVDEVKGGWDEKTGIMVAKPNESSISHEIDHSIDPHIEERDGTNRIVSELFAHLSTAIYHYDLTGISQEELRDALTDTLSDNGYYQIFTKRVQPQMSHDQFKTLCGASVEVALSLRGEKGDVEALRDIVQSKTLQELFEKAGKDMPSI